MKAVVYRNYGSPDVLQLENLEKPIPNDDEVLVKINASSVNPLDWHTMRGTPYLVRLGEGIRIPKNNTLGVDLAGQVEAVGKDVKEFQTGDEVFGVGNGAFAEYVCCKEKSLVKKSPRITFEQVAALPIAGITALQGLRDYGGIQAKQRVLVNGASGGVGTFAVQIAKAFGAEVTGVCSTRNIELVKSIGADRVIDYTKEDFTKNSDPYDLIFDTIGSQSLLKCRRVLTPKGTIVMVGSQSKGRLLGPLTRSIKGIIMGKFVSQKIVMFLAKVKREDLLTLQELMAAKKIVSVIDKRYGLNEISKAIHYQEKGHARGKVIISLINE